MSNSQIFVSFMARKSKSQEAQDAVFQLGDPAHLITLAKNPNLTKAIWWKLAAVKDNMPLTTELVKASRNLDDDQIRYILKDKRGQIRTVLFSNAMGAISKPYGDYLIGSKMVNPRLAAAWLQGNSQDLSTPGGNIPEYMIRAVARIENGQYQFAHLKNKKIYTAPDAVHILANLKDGGRLLESDLTALFDLRPELLTPAALKLSKTPNALVALGVATSRHNFDQLLFRKALEVAEPLISNSPVTARSKQIVESIIANPNVADGVARDALALISLAEQLNHYRYTRPRSAVALYQQDVEANRPRRVVTQDWLTLPQKQQKLLAHNLGDAPERGYPTLAAWFPNSDLPGPKPEPRSITLSQASPASVLDLESLRQEQITTGVEQPLLPFGVTGFSTLLHLSTDWHGSLAELIEITITTCA